MIKKFSSVSNNVSKSLWNNYEMYSFQFNGHDAFVIFPDNFREQKQWVWKTEFLNAFPYTEIEMLKNGYYIIHYSVSNRYGDDTSVDLMNNFYLFMTQECGFAKTGVLEGFSRGGLYARRYANKYPKHVSALYLDAPVIDISSWPGGHGLSQRAEKEWLECLECYGYSKFDIQGHKAKLQDELNSLIQFKIPLIMVFGDVDLVVPYDENGKYIEKLYTDNSLSFKYIKKENVGHHPHSLENPKEICEFLMKYYPIV